MNRLEDVLKEAVSLVEPSRSEEAGIRRVAEEIRRRVEEASSGEPAVQSVELGGSYAKGTWLKGDVDIDVFVKFSPAISKKSLEELGVRIGQAALAPYRHLLRYSEHPYVEGFVDDVKINVVACYDVKEGFWKSAADRSPFHTVLIKSSFDARLKTEARLLKKFMKGAGIYGAEIKIQGFSGYVCEVLVHKYGSFRQVLEAASGFKEGEVVSVEDVDGKEIRKKFATPLIVLDPVDNRRNLGAAISPEKVAAFIMASRTFLQSPSIAFFKATPPKKRLAPLEKSPLLDNLLVAVFHHKPRMVDIIWGQLQRSEHHLAKQLSKAGFNVLRSCSASDEESSSGFVFLLDSQTLPKSQVKMGPKVNMAKDTAVFLDRNRASAETMWIGRDLRVYALVERRHWRASDMLAALLTGQVEGSGVAPGLKREVESTSETFSGRDVLKAAAGKAWLIEALNRVVATEQFTPDSG